MNDYTKNEIYNAIIANKFYCECYKKDYAFDIKINGQRIEVGPIGCSYDFHGFYAYNCETKVRTEYSLFNSEQEATIWKIAA